MNSGKLEVKQQNVKEKGILYGVQIVYFRTIADFIVVSICYVDHVSSACFIFYTLILADIFS